MIDPLDLVRSLGIKVGLDWDESVTYDIPEILDAFKLRQLLDEHADYFARRLRGMSRVHQERYLGGPLQGKRHHCEWLFEAVKMERGRWAVYGRPSYKEPRLFYLGEVTAKAKAKAFAFMVLAEKHGYKEPLWKRLRQ